MIASRGNRAYVCIGGNNCTWKVSWLNESTTGLYFGLFTGPKTAHFSYHADGRSHLKNSSGAASVAQPAEPINQIQGWRQLLAQALDVSDESLAKYARPFSVDPRAVSTAFLDRKILGDTRFLLADLYLFEKCAEKEMLDAMSLPRRGIELLATFSMGLRYYPMHAVGLAFWRFAGEETAI
jgi:hypothetical protein